MERFDLHFDTKFRPLLLGFGASPRNSFVTVSDTEVFARFGFVRLSTPIGNITGLERSGNYRPWKAIGVRMSLTDGGLTFGSNTDAGVCLKFREPVTPKPSLLGKSHPGLTVTVADPDGFVAALEKRLARPTDD